MRRVGGAVRLADRPRRIEEHGGRQRLARLRQLVGLARAHVALRARRGRDHREPHDALPRRFLLEVLHVAGVVVLPHVRAVVIRPLEHDDLAALVGETDRGPGR